MDPHDANVVVRVNGQPVSPSYFADERKETKQPQEDKRSSDVQGDEVKERKQDKVSKAGGVDGEKEDKQFINADEGELNACILYVADAYPEWQRLTLETMSRLYASGIHLKVDIAQKPQKPLFEVLIV